MKDNSHLTAISRKGYPAPTKWLVEQNLIRGRTLDYGCGKCAPLNPIDWDNYDPHHYPCVIVGGYDTILCNYVLCVLPRNERIEVLRQIQFLLKSDGIAYISVRNDRPKNGWGLSKRGTYQGRVGELPLRCIHKEHGFRTYVLTAKDKL